MSDGDIGDIKQVVHAIQSDLRGYREDQLRQDGRIAKIEARQDAQADRMTQESARLHEKVDDLRRDVFAWVAEIKSIVTGTRSDLNDHTRTEDEDRKVLIQQQRKTYNTLLGTLIVGILVAAASAWFARGAA